MSYYYYNLSGLIHEIRKINPSRRSKCTAKDNFMAPIIIKHLMNNSINDITVHDAFKKYTYTTAYLKWFVYDYGT